MRALVAGAIVSLRTSLLTRAFIVRTAPYRESNVFGGGEIVGLIILVLDIIAIISVLMGTSSVGRKLLWIIVILILPVLGMILYFLFGRSVEDA